MSSIIDPKIILLLERCDCECVQSYFKGATLTDLADLPARILRRRLQTMIPIDAILILPPQRDREEMIANILLEFSSLEDEDLEDEDETPTPIIVNEEIKIEDHLDLNVNGINIDDERGNDSCIKAFQEISGDEMRNRELILNNNGLIRMSPKKSTKETRSSILEEKDEKRLLEEILPVAEHRKNKKARDCDTCPICKKTFNSTAARANHMEKHRTLPKCTYCPQIFTRRYTRDRHQRMFCKGKSKRRSRNKDPLKNDNDGGSGPGSEVKTVESSIPTIPIRRSTRRTRTSRTTFIDPEKLFQFQENLTHTHPTSQSRTFELLLNYLN